MNLQLYQNGTNIGLQNKLEIIMTKIVYRLVFNRKRRLNAQGKALVQIEARQQSKRCYFTTYLYLSPKEWDRRTGLVKNHPNAEALNYKLLHLIVSLEKLELELWREGQLVTLSLLKEQNRHSQRLSSFIRFFEEELEVAPLRASTKSNQRTTLLLLKQYRPDLLFGEMNLDFLMKFEKLLRMKGYNSNTIVKHFKHLKRYVNLAVNKGKLSPSSNPFLKFRIKTSDFHHSYLRAEELLRLERLQLSGRFARYRKSLDAFLFCCYSGLRYSDFTQLTAANIHSSGDEVWLVYHSVKTQVEVRSPLHLLFGGKAKLLLKQYVQNLGALFHLPGNSNVNKHLQTIARLAEIDKHISFHTARHTHATLLIYSGVNITTVQRLLGHRSVKTTQGYTEMMDSTIVNDLLRHKWK